MEDKPINYSVDDELTSSSIQEIVDEESGTPKKVGVFGRIKHFLSFLGPAILISVGYVDPGNWETDIQGGYIYEYKLLWVLVLSNVLAIVLQTLCARLGLVTGYDLAQQCRRYYHPTVSFVLWVLAEVAIIATDLAEVLGTAIGLKLLFNIPMVWGVIITGADTLVFLVFELLGHRFMEIFVLLLMGIISGCFIVEMIYSKPDFGKLLLGSIIPQLPPGSLPIATGILGATIMPHNLYLHSGIILSRRSKDKTETWWNNLWAFLDGFIHLNLAMFINASILIVAANAFFNNKDIHLDDTAIIEDSYRLLNNVLGPISQLAFGVALLCAGQSSTLTGTIAGQLVMEGFVNVRIRPWIRRFFTRCMAIIPAVIALLISDRNAANAGTDTNAGGLLLWSQIVLSVQLPFAIIPLIRLTSHKLMGKFKNPWYVQILSWIVVFIVIILNVWLVFDSFNSLGFFDDPDQWWIWAISFVIAVITIAFTVYISLVPLHLHEYKTPRWLRAVLNYIEVTPHMWLFRYIIVTRVADIDPPSKTNDDEDEVNPPSHDDFKVDQKLISHNDLDDLVDE
mmetsp:Transcript_11286/g.16683  ORF Transcript_11286/g.16683 Transcript_11286/m.16683 type:complete len:566 (+) Transcript_11286:4390-6087(+)